MNFIHKYFYDLYYDMVYDIMTKTIEHKMDVYFQEKSNYINNLMKNLIDEKFQSEIDRLSPIIEESLKDWFVEKIRDGKYPSDSKDYWVCMFCGHIDKRDCKYCSECGAKW